MLTDTSSFPVGGRCNVSGVSILTVSLGIIHVHVCGLHVLKWDRQLQAVLVFSFSNNAKASSRTMTPIRKLMRSQHHTRPWERCWRPGCWSLFCWEVAGTPGTFSAWDLHSFLRPVLACLQPSSFSEAILSYLFRDSVYILWTKHVKNHRSCGYGSACCWWCIPGFCFKTEGFLIISNTLKYWWN